MNTWSFTGRVTAAAKRKAGERTVWQVVAVDNREKPAMAVFDYWYELAPPVGSTVFATGTVRGREYEGKYYAGLTAHECYALRAPPASDADRRDRDETAGQAAGPAPAKPEPQDDIPF